MTYTYYVIQRPYPSHFIGRVKDGTETYEFWSKREGGIWFVTANAAKSIHSKVIMETRNLADAIDCVRQYWENMPDSDEKPRQQQYCDTLVNIA